MMDTASNTLAPMDPERKLELIALLARDETWKAVILIGNELLDTYYPASMFNDASSSHGAAYIVALRDILARLRTAT